MRLFGRKKGGAQGKGPGAQLLQFAKGRKGVEAYLESGAGGGATVTLVAADGEWTRRRVGNPDAVRKFAANLGIPVHDSASDSFPENMREESVDGMSRPT